MMVTAAAEIGRGWGDAGGGENEENTAIGKTLTFQKVSVRWICNDSF